MFEFYGSVKIHCPQTGYSAEIEFKSKVKNSKKTN